MKIAFIARSTLYTVPGGDTIQVLQTARCLEEAGINVSIHPTDAVINYGQYDLLHFFNITRPADILFHVLQSHKPYVISPILIDYSEYDKKYRSGFSGIMLRYFSPDTNEYIKTIARWLKRRDSMRSNNYLWKGQRKSIRYVLQHAAMLLPNSEMEYQRLKTRYAIEKEYVVVPNGVDQELFQPFQYSHKDESLILCAARIEGIKNQLNLIKALNNTRYQLILVGSAAPNQKDYYDRCRKIAASNIHFHEHISQETLVGYYKKAKVHVLPSWFETCGLSSLEAAALGCNIVITEKGCTREYFGDHAFFCDPADPVSILSAVDKAAKTNTTQGFQEKILNNYTWQKAATITSEAYEKILSA